MATGEAAAPTPVPDVRLDSAGLGGAGLLLFKEVVERVDATDEVEKFDIVESRFGFLDDADGGKWKPGLDGVGGFDGVLTGVFGRE